MTANGNTTLYVLDGQNVVQEGHMSDGQYVADATYLYGPRGIEYRKDESTGQIKWYLYDGLGSVIGEMDSTGNVTYTAKYDVYGALRGSTGSSNSKHKFCGSLGHTSEPDTGGLIYMRARWMDPVTGRFISEDPGRDGDNWYVYCGNNPVNRYDVNGHSWETVGLILSALVVEVLGQLSVHDKGKAGQIVDHMCKEIGSMQMIAWGAKLANDAMAADKRSKLTASDKAAGYAGIGIMMVGALCAAAQADALLWIVEGNDDALWHKERMSPF